MKKFTIEGKEFECEKLCPAEFLKDNPKAKQEGGEW